MQLSKRLKRISEFVDSGKVVFDVGSDHGLLPCYLVTHSISPKVYAGDNKKGPLSKAIENIKLNHLEGKVYAVLSDGLDLAPDDVEIVTISGMGQFVVESILEKADLNRYDKIIIQVNRDMDLMRQYISDHQYTILDEDVVKDDYFYEIIVFSTKKHLAYSSKEIKFGPLNLKRKSTFFKEYLEFQLNKYRMILKKHPNASVQEYIDELETILQELF